MRALFGLVLGWFILPVYRMAGLGWCLVYVAVLLIGSGLYFYWEQRRAQREVQRLIDRYNERYPDSPYQLRAAMDAIRGERADNE